MKCVRWADTMSFFTYICIPLLMAIIPVRAVHDVRVMIPPKVLSGSKVTLKCLFDLQGAPLYTVKWYRGSYEFYRYVPRERHPAMAFSLQGLGLDVDISGSNANQVTLRAVPKILSGQFTCEVSADAPSFSTNSASANMTIIELGIRRPLLTPDGSVHYIGTPLQVNCSAQATDPAPKISFYIDDIKVDSDLVQNVSPGVAVLLAQNMSYELGPRWLRCEATVPGVYHVSSASVPILLKHDKDSSFLQSPSWLTFTGIFVLNVQHSVQHKKICKQFVFFIIISEGFELEHQHFVRHTQTNNLKI